MQEKKGAREEGCRAFPRGAKQAVGGWLLPSAHLPWLGAAARVHFAIVILALLFHSLMGPDYLNN